MQQKPILGQADAAHDVPPVEPRVATPDATSASPRETGGRAPAVSAGLDPTRYGDWEKNGRCIDF